jgi:hypothetical protein
MGIPCFLLTPVAKIRVWARRYNSGTPNCCSLSPGEYSYHQNMNLIGDFDYPHVWGKSEDWIDFTETIRPPAGDPIWPTHCKCGAPITDDLRGCERGGQMFTHRLHSRSDGGPLTTLYDAPTGALWYAWWLDHRTDNSGLYGWDWDNQTEPPLMCRTPSGSDWCIDGRASNCTMKEERTHRCWVRHGVPPNIHVDKNGHTCQAGAGSIVSGNWHGFLHNGQLVP